MKSPTPVQCIRLHCLSCQHGDEFAVANCSSLSCALHPVRPNQGLQGKSPDDYDLDELEQQVLDNLNFKGLKDILSERPI